MPGPQDPLLSAVRGGDLAGVRRLAEESPERLDAKGPDGLTALMVAASIGAEEVVALLLELGADAALRDGEGRTAADLAFGNGHADLGQRLGPDSEAARVLR
jgi:ankyrin repeat protein